MKKYLLLIVVFLLLPISVFAIQESKENLFKAIEDIQNVLVDDTVEILETKVDKDGIHFIMNEDDQEVTRNVFYSYQDYFLSFHSGNVVLEMDKKGNIQVGEIENNQYAFYLYSILESLSTAPYEEDNYYNSTLIEKRIEEGKKELFNNPSKIIQYYNTGKTFGLQLVGEKISTNQVKVTIYYQYFLDGDDTILVNPIVQGGQEELLKNPETGNFNFFITSLLLIVIGLAAYTYYNSGEVEEK